ncbi:MAG: histidine phosphatase family protein [Patescibacteria group bacterium]
MKIHVIRHGLTKYNKLKLINGQSIDEGLEPEGFLQAEEAIGKIPKNVVRIYASNMQRTRDTAETINKKLNLQISYHSEVREVHFGTFSGRNWDDIAKEYGTKHREGYLAVDYDFTPFGGESSEMVKDRVKKLIDEIKKNHKDDEEVLIVAHGGILRIFHNLYGDKEVKHEYIENASVHEFEV